MNSWTVTARHGATRKEDKNEKHIGRLFRKNPKVKKKKNLMAPFYYGWGSTASRLQPLRGGSLLFTIKSCLLTLNLMPYTS